MTPKEFIEKRLADLKISENITALKTEKDMIDFIYRSIMSKKFRKFSVAPEYIEQMRKAVEINVHNNEPIKFAFSFGGYKLWRLEEAPEPDWAELFAIIYYCRWMKPILEVYRPGVWFDFVTDGVILSQMNNLTKEESETYRKEFKKLLDFIKPYAPTNLKFTLTEVGDFYKSKDEFEEDLKDKVSKLAATFPNGLPGLAPGDAERIELNVRKTIEQEKDPRWREKVKLLHDAYMSVSKKRPYYKTEDKIMVLAGAFRGMLALGTTKTSAAKFWVGTGALKKNEGDYQEYVLSPSQLENTTLMWEPVSIDGLEGKNFHKIKIF
jgi:hypothetical protein